MSPWLFNLYMDGVVREMYARAEGNGVNGGGGGVEDGSCFRFCLWMTQH